MTPGRTEYSFVATEHTAQDMVCAFIKFQYRQPRLLIVFGIIFVVFLFSSAAGGHFVQGMVFRLVLFVLFMVVAGILSVRRLTKRFKSMIAIPGATMQTSFTDTVLEVTLPKSRASIDYESFASIDSDGKFVFIKQQGSRIYTILPAELVPETERHNFRLNRK